MGCLCIGSKDHYPPGAFAVLLATIVMSILHILIGCVSVCIGVISSVQAEVWLAHRVSPIWSGGFYILTGILGFLCVKKKTPYLILCFTAFSVVSLVTAIVSIQLLRLGLVNHTTDGHTFQKEELDMLTVVALIVSGIEIIFCLVSSLVSCRFVQAAKKEVFKKRDGAFHVQIYGEKDVVIVPNRDRSKLYMKPGERNTQL